MVQEIAAAWESYRVGVIPENAPALQITECRRAFYAGAHSLFTSLLRSLDPGEEPTENDLKKMDEIHEELMQFNADVLTGKA